jgi:hypothetical protein
MQPVRLTSEVRVLLNFFSLCSWDAESSDREAHNAIAEIQAIGAVAKLCSCREPLDIADEKAWGWERGVHIFSFGAYGDKHVLAFGCLADALEDAAATLKPGYFTEPELPDGYESLDEKAQDAAHNEATEDLTYTESGYLASWAVSPHGTSLQDAIDFAYQAW